MRSGEGVRGPGFMVAHILRRDLESNYAKVGSYRRKSLEVYKEHTDRHSILCI